MVKWLSLLCDADVVETAILVSAKSSLGEHAGIGKVVGRVQTTLPIENAAL